MSKIDRTQWQNPLTALGLRLASEGGAGEFQIHEVGAMQLHDQWQHRAVCSPFWRLFYEFTPGAWVKCAGRKIELDRDCAVILPDGVTFDCGGRAGVEHLWLHFSLYPSRPAGSPQPLVPVVGADFFGVASALQTATRQREVEMARHLGMALLHVAFAGLAPGWLAETNPRLQRVLGWLEQNISRPITNEVLAAQAGLGIEAFIRWFKGQTGRTPAAYVAERRVREAGRRLALSDDSIEHIAEGLGFSNRHHFSRVFAQYAGCGPATFRKGGAK